MLYDGDDPIELTPAPFVFWLALTLAIAWITVGRETWRAARVAPSEVLRSE